MPYGIVYRYTNKINGKNYVGQSIKTLQRRWSGHLADAKNPKFPFHRAIRKYGAECFEGMVVCECSSQEELDRQEDFYAKFFDAMIPKGYTVRTGGRGGPCPESVKKKISQKLRGHLVSKKTRELIGKSAKGRIPPNKGKTGFQSHSDETRSKISKSLIGRKISDATRLKIREAAIERERKKKWLKVRG